MRCIIILFVDHSPIDPPPPTPLPHIMVFVSRLELNLRLGAVNINHYSYCYNITGKGLSHTPGLDYTGSPTVQQHNPKQVKHRRMGE